MNQKQNPLQLIAWCGVIALLMVAGCNRQNDSQKKEAEKPGAYRVQVKKDEPKVEYALTDEQTKYLWDLEHHANILGAHGFKPLIAAIIAGSKDDILNVIGDPICTVLDHHAKSIAYQSSVLDLQRTISGTEPLDAESAANLDRLSADEFVDWLLEKRALFGNSPEPKARFDVKTILPPQDDEYWLVKCIHRIWGNDPKGGPLEVTIHMTLRTHEIEKSRMDLGSWMHECHVTQVDVFRSGQPLFAEVDPKQTRIFPEDFYDNWISPRKEINTGGIYACDYNRDGITDLFVTDLREDAGRMYTGKKDGKFTDETYLLKLELAKNSRIAAFVDLDNDGWEDVFFPGLPKIYRNSKGEKFLNYTGNTNLPLLLDLAPGPLKRISGVIPADFDLDGDIDLYITRSVKSVGSWLESVQPQLAHNQLLRNDGNWKFTDVTRRTGTDGEGRSTFAAVWTDVNNDRYPDLYMINEFGNGSLLVNQQGKKFEKRLLTPGQSDFGSMGLTCGDYNNDGNMDIYVSNMYSKAGSRVMGNMKDGTYPPEVQSRLRSMVAGSELYENQGNLKFKPVGKEYQIHAAGWAWGASMADFNNDGWLDLYVAAGFISRDREKPDG